MADALKAELAAADAVKAGKGPWLTLSASYGHKAGTLSSSSRDGAPARWVECGFQKARAAGEIVVRIIGVSCLDDVCCRLIGALLGLAVHVRGATRGKGKCASFRVVP